MFDQQTLGSGKKLIVSVRASLFLQVQVVVFHSVEFLRVGGFLLNGLMHVESEPNNHET